MPKKFIWLIQSSIPRKGPQLTQGEEHDAADYSAEVVNYWVESGAAKWVKEKTKKEEKD